nr:unnamed protein product [Callosobruchus chinensis]
MRGAQGHPACNRLHLHRALRHHQIAALDGPPLSQWRHRQLSRRLVPALVTRQPATVVVRLRSDRWRPLRSNARLTLLAENILVSMHKARRSISL